MKRTTDGIYGISGIMPEKPATQAGNKEMKMPRCATNANGALKELEQLADRRKREQYGSVPSHAIPRSKMNDKSANGLTNCILKWLELNNCWATRVNTTGRYLQGEQYTDVLGHRKQHPGKWIPGTTRNGTADIHAIINGRHISIEVKVGRDRMSEAQHQTKKAIEQSGGIYWVIRSFDEFMSQYKTLTQTDKTK